MRGRRRAWLGSGELEVVEAFEDVLHRINNAEQNGPPEPCKTASEVATHTYNGAGNETKISGSETGSTTFSYNNLNQLKALTPPGEAEQAATFLGEGQTLMTGLGTVGLQNSLLGITKQTNSSGTSYYARTPEGVMVDERLPTASYNPVYDAQGDVVGLLNSTGELVQTIRYGPYGENTNVTPIGTGPVYSATTDPFLFQGGYHTPGGSKGEGNVPNGLYHFGARYYDPTSGTWTQVDPVASEAQYAFAGDDPSNATDPEGTYITLGPLGFGCEGKAIALHIGFHWEGLSEKAYYAGKAIIVAAVKRCGFGATGGVSLGKLGSSLAKDAFSIRSGLLRGRLGLRGVGDKRTGATGKGLMSRAPVPFVIVELLGAFVAQIVLFRVVFDWHAPEWAHLGGTVFFVIVISLAIRARKSYVKRRGDDIH